MPVLLAGFSIGVIQIIPYTKTVACCLGIPAGVWLALWLDGKSTGDQSLVSLKKALITGLLTGLIGAFIASFLDLFITFITKTNEFVASFNEFQKMMTNLPVDEGIKTNVMEIFLSIRNDIVDHGFSFFYAITTIFNNLVINVIFGLIGGVIARQIINIKRDEKNG